MKMVAGLTVILALLLMSCVTQSSVSPTAKNYEPYTMIKDGIYDQYATENNGGYSDMEMNNYIDDATRARLDDFAVRANFDVDNTFYIIREALGPDARVTLVVSSLIWPYEIRGAIRAELIDDGHREDGRRMASRILEIESEDNRVYHLYIGDGYLVRRIMCVETGDTVFFMR